MKSDVFASPTKPSSTTGPESKVPFSNIYNPLGGDFTNFKIIVCMFMQID